MLRDQFTDETLQEWFDARVATTSAHPITAMLTPDVALYRDYRRFCDGTHVPREAVLDALAFSEQLDQRYGSANRLVSVDDAPPTYYPCRTLTLVQPIRVAA